MQHIRSDLTTCNVCRKLVSELNLMNHRKILHPERFKSDRITCSGCNLVLRALDFDNHDCGVDADDVRVAESQTHMKGAMDRKDTVEKNMDAESSKLIIEIKEQNGLMEKVSSSILCPECQLFFAGAS